MLLLPLLLVQGMRVKRTALRLPEGAPPNHGLIGADDDASTPGVIKILGVGDSVIAGTGLDQMSESVTASLARHWHQRTGLPVSWQAEGANGDRLADVIARIQTMPRGKVNIALVSVGVNDVTGLTGLLKWQLQLTTLIPLLTQRAERVVFLGVPPMQLFTALPQPLAMVLGLRAAMLDRSLRQAAALIDSLTWLDLQLLFDAEHLAADGYHPNAIACEEMGAQIAELLVNE